MTRLIGVELVERLADILDTDIFSVAYDDNGTQKVLEDHPLFFPNSKKIATLPAAYDKVLRTPKSSIIKALNDISITSASNATTANEKINSFIRALGDFFGDDGKLTRLREVDADTLEAVYQLHLRLLALEPSAPEILAGSTSPSSLSIDTPKIILDFVIPGLPDLQIVDPALITFEQQQPPSDPPPEPILIDITSSISGDSLIIQINQVLLAGETYTLSIPSRCLKSCESLNRIPFSQDFILPAVEVTPELDLGATTPADPDVDYLRVKEVVIPLLSRDHLNTLVIDDTKISVSDGANSIIDVSSPLKIENNNLIIPITSPMAPTTLYTVIIDPDAIMDGSLGCLGGTHLFTTVDFVEFTVINKPFSMLINTRRILEDDLESGFKFVDIMSFEDVYSSNRRVYLFKKRNTNGLLDIVSMKPSNLYDEALDSNDFGSYFDIDLITGELYFYHDMIEDSFDFELVVFEVVTTEAEAISWASTNLT